MPGRIPKTPRMFYMNTLKSLKSINIPTLIIGTLIEKFRCDTEFPKFVFSSLDFESVSCLGEIEFEIKLDSGVGYIGCQKVKLRERKNSICFRLNGVKNRIVCNA